MKNNLSYVLITPYSLSKSRTGGIIARLLSRARNIELVGAQVIEPSPEFAKKYAQALRNEAAPNPSFLASYFEKNVASTADKRQRALLLLFRGEDVCKQLSRIAGHLYSEHRGADEIEGETIRDTYADLVVNAADSSKFDFFEPAVVTARNEEDARAVFKEMFVPLLKKSPNIIDGLQYPAGAKPERTLIIIKPENWSFSSARPGEIIDMFSQTGLRIIGAKVLSFSLKQALDFYGPVEEVLRKKLGPVFGGKAKECLEREFKLPLPEDVEKGICESFGAYYAKDQFYQIVDFMSGHRPDRNDSRPVKCMVIVYEGPQAVQKIRDVLGPTDPAKAPEGTIRREFGSNVMVNAAHASDSPESFERERKIIKIDENDTLKIVEEYLR